MIYILNEKGKLQSLKEISIQYNVPLALVQSRYNRGIKDIAELTQPKHEMLRK